MPLVEQTGYAGRSRRMLRDDACESMEMHRAATTPQNMQNAKEALQMADSDNCVTRTCPVDNPGPALYRNLEGNPVGTIGANCVLHNAVGQGTPYHVGPGPSAFVYDMGGCVVGQMDPLGVPRDPGGKPMA